MVANKKKITSKKASKKAVSKKAAKKPAAKKSKTSTKKTPWNEVLGAKKPKLFRKTVKNTRAKAAASESVDETMSRVFGREQNRSEYREALFAASSPFYVGNSFAYTGPAELWLLLTSFAEGRPLPSVLSELKVAQERTLSEMLPVQINHDARAGTPIGIGTTIDAAAAAAADAERKTADQNDLIYNLFEAVLESEKTALTFLSKNGVHLAGGTKSHWMTFALDHDGTARCLWTHDGNRNEPIEFKKKIEKKTDLFELLRNAQRGVAFHIEEIIKRTGAAPLPLTVNEVDRVTASFVHCYNELTMACVVNGKPVIDIMDDHIIPMEMPTTVWVDVKVEDAPAVSEVSDGLAAEASVSVAEAVADSVSTVTESPPTEAVVHDPAGSDEHVSSDVENTDVTPTPTTTAAEVDDDDLPF